MPRSETRPPRLALALLRRVLWPRVLRDIMIDELTREFESRGASPVRARVWFWRAVLGIAARRVFVDPFDREVAVARRLHRAHAGLREAGEMNFLEREARMWTQLQSSLKALSRAPTFTATAVLTLTLGLGSSFAIFALVDSVVLEPLPYPRAERLVDVYSSVPGLGFDRWEVTQAGYLHFRENARTLESVGAFRVGELTVESELGAERVPGALVTSDLLETLGARPGVGRLFGARDDLPGGPAVAVLGHDYWVSRYASDADIVGRPLVAAGASRRIVGVLEPGFDLPGTPVDILLPYRMDPGATPNDSHSIRVIGRMTAVADLEAVQDDLDGLTELFPDLFPEVYSGPWMEDAEFRTRVQPLHALVVDRTVSRALWVLLGAVSVVLLTAVANVANLHLARQLERQGEQAVRRALGASARDLFRRYMAEGLVVAGGATVLGIVAADVGLRVFRGLAPASLPRLDAVGLDGSSMILAAALGALTTMGLALMPILRLDARAPIDALGGVGRAGTQSTGRKSVRGALVVLQVALALMLLTASGLMVRSFRALTAVDPGFDPGGRVAVDVGLSGSRYPTQMSVHAFFRDLIREVEALPGVLRAGAASSIPLESGLGCYSVWSEARPGDDQPPCISLHVATAGYFETMGMELAEGRWFEPGEAESGAGPLIVTEALAERLWPGRSALGEGASIHGYRSPWFRVVGVAEGLRLEGLNERPGPAIFLPMLSPRDARLHLMHRSRMTLVVHTSSAEPLGLVPAIRRLVAERDPTAATAKPRLMEAVVADSRSDTTFATLLLVLAGAVALALASVGLYAVVSRGATDRTREIGVRMALGAEGWQVWTMVLASSGRLVALGLALGLVGSVAGTRLLETLLFEVRPIDPVTLVATSGLLLVVAGVAAFLPADRAARVDPVVALRGD